MARVIRFAVFFTVATVCLVGIGCQDYNMIGPGDWRPAEQPEQLGETMREDIFIQRTAEASDILFVVDNSCSMQEEQQALLTNFWNFIQFFVDSGLDYHIGVTVLDDWQTQPPIGQLYGPTRYIEPSTPDPVGAFTANMTMGGDGVGSCEVGLEASYRALTPPLVDGYNAGFYRQDALLSIVIVSDEVDGSINGCPAISYMEYIPWLTTLKGPHSIDMIHFAAIIGDQPNGCNSSWGQADPGRGYYEVYTALGDEHATNFSICNQDWDEVMTQLGLEAAGLRTEFHLSLVPVEGTLQVWLDPDGEDGPEEEFEIFEDETYIQQYSYVYNRVSNSLDFVFETMPPEAAQLRVEYQIAEDA
jgi:hypothetical protein